MTKILEWQTTPDEKNIRLDAALAKKFPEISRSALAEMIRNGEVLLDQKEVKPSHKLSGKELIILTIQEKKEIKTLPPTPLTFNIIFEDESIISVDKPKGMSVHPGAGKEKISVVSCVLGHSTLSPIGAPLRPGVVHRLDKGTSGVMVLAKTSNAHHGLSKAFSTRSVGKEYFALVQGAILENKGRIEAALDRDRTNRKRMKVTKPDRGRMAVSLFEVAERFQKATLLKVSILTGRTHQIRVHFSFIGHPLIGDVLYGGSKFQGKAIHYLHSSKLRFIHPITGLPIELTAPLPQDFQNAIEKLRCDPR